MAKQTVLSAFAELSLGAHAIGGPMTLEYGRVKCLICGRAAPSKSQVDHKPDCSLVVVTNYITKSLKRDKREIEAGGGDGSQE